LSWRSDSISEGVKRSGWETVKALASASVNGLECRHSPTVPFECHPYAFIKTIGGLSFFIGAASKRGHRATGYILRLIHHNFSVFFLSISNDAYPHGG